MADLKICSIDGCSKAHDSRGWCSTHYRRWKLYGDPLGGGAFNGDPEQFLRETAIPFVGEECLTWPYAKNEQGRGKIYVNGKLEFVCRIICEEVNGPPPTPKHEAAHNCGNGHLGCCNQSHLRWATHTENQADKLIHGTDCRGEKHPMSKLSPADVIAIRALSGSMSQREIAKQFGVCRQTIGDILNRKIWSHL